MCLPAQVEARDSFVFTLAPVGTASRSGPHILRYPLSESRRGDAMWCGKHVAAVFGKREEPDLALEPVAEGGHSRESVCLRVLCVCIAS